MSKIKKEDVQISEKLELKKVDRELEIKNKELEEKVKNLTLMVEKLLEQQNKEEFKKDTAEEKYREIEPTKRVLLMNMVNAGGTYKTYTGIRQLGLINLVKYNP